MIRTIPRKIAHILPFPSVGGTEHATLRIARAVDPDLFTSVAFCQTGADDVERFLDEAGLPWRTYVPPVPSYRHSVSYLTASWKLARDLKREHVDLVHCADLLAAHHAALAGWLAGLPVLCHIRNRYEAVSRRDCSFLWPVRRFVFVSMNTWKHFGCRVPASRGVVVYDGLEIAENGQPDADKVGVRDEFGIPARAPIIGMMARVAPQKDFATLGRAAAQVLSAEPDAHFLVAGDYASPDNREHYERVRRDLEACGVASSFVFTGYRTDVARLFNAIDVFVLSTHREGLPLVLLEAMVRGKPVVATAVDGIPEIVGDGETGLLVNHRDHDQLAACILRLLRDRAYATRLAEAGRRRVRAQFTGERFAAHMNRVYGAVLQPRARPTASGLSVAEQSRVDGR